MKIKGRSVGEILNNGPRYVRKELFLRLQKVYTRRNLHRTTPQIMERRRAALDTLKNGGTILFLCHGNICRSPFAERYTRQQLAARGLNGITVTSSGLLDHGDQQSPLNARTAARRWGVDLTDNGSTHANAEAIEQADLILLMDYRNYHNFTTQFPDAADRMFLLGIFDDREEVPISDPYRDTLEAFGRSYDRIVASVNGLLDTFESRLKNSPRTTHGD